MVKNKLSYIPRLDSVRAIAVILVLLHHLLPVFPWTKYIGPYGVGLFFVLSGFLITRILLAAKNELNEGTSSIGQILKRFYIRRSIRILPIYYLLFGCLFLFHQFVEIDIKGSPWYYITYTSNVLLFKMQSWIGMFSHTWSLSVEEQFYFVWPFVILLIPFRNLKFIIFIVIGLGFAYSLFFPIVWPNLDFFNYQTIACMPAFAIGALMAYHNFEGKGYSTYFLAICKVVSVVFPAILCTIAYFSKTNPADIVGQLYYALPGACFVIIAIYNRSDLLDKLLYENKIFIHLGKISYGIYLYHMPIYYLWPYLNHRIYKAMHVTNLTWQFTIDVLFCGLCAYFVAILSWYFIEKPISKLKSQF